VWPHVYGLDKVTGMKSLINLNVPSNAKKAYESYGSLKIY